MALSLVCLRCNYEELLQFEKGFPYSCPSCDGILDVRYDAVRLSRAAFVSCFQKRGSSFSMWRYAPFLPLPTEIAPITLHEGGTPLVEADALSSKSDGIRVYIKDETRNPTGSFKDRPIGLGVNYALRAGYTQLVVASSGNGAVSTAAYAARAAISALVVVPRSSSHSPKLRQARAYGARVLLLDGDYRDVFRITQQLMSHLPVADMTTTFGSPIPTEGNKTVAYELYEQMGGEVPDWILVPVGAGPLLWGTWKGYGELLKCELTCKMPRMVAVQATGCAPIAQAYDQGRRDVEACLQPDTIADGISDGLLDHELDGAQTLSAIYASRGAAVAVADEITLRALKEMASKVGVFAEPTGAIGLAGMWELQARGMLRPGESIVLMVTGHGLKRPDAIEESSLDLVPPRLDAVLNYLGAAKL